MYLASIALFVALYQAFQVVGYVGQDAMLSPDAVRRLRALKHCALTIIGFVAGAELFIILQNADDPQGGFFMGVLIAFIASVVVTATADFESNRFGAHGKEEVDGSAKAPHIPREIQGL